MAHTATVKAVSGGKTELQKENDRLKAIIAEASLKLASLETKLQAASNQFSNALLGSVADDSLTEHLKKKYNIHVLNFHVEEVTFSNPTKKEVRDNSGALIEVHLGEMIVGIRLKGYAERRPQGVQKTNIYGGTKELKEMQKAGLLTPAEWADLNIGLSNHTLDTASKRMMSEAAIKMSSDAERQRRRNIPRIAKDHSKRAYRLYCSDCDYFQMLDDVGVAFSNELIHCQNCSRIICSSDDIKTFRE